jgi:hypothetical protein
MIDQKKKKIRDFLDDLELITSQLIYHGEKFSIPQVINNRMFEQKVAIKEKQILEIKDTFSDVTLAIHTLIHSIESINQLEKSILKAQAAKIFKLFLEFMNKLVFKETLFNQLYTMDYIQFADHLKVIKEAIQDTKTNEHLKVSV